MYICLSEFSVLFVLMATILWCLFYWCLHVCCWCCPVITTQTSIASLLPTSSGTVISTSVKGGALFHFYKMTYELTQRAMLW